MPKDPNRDTIPPTWKAERVRITAQRPVVPRPTPQRTEYSHQLPAKGETEESDREVLLRSMNEMEARFEQRLTESRRATQAEALRPKKRDWGDIATKFVAALALIGTSLGAMKPTKDERLDKGYEDLAKALRTVEAHDQGTASSLEALRAWLAGYFNATGVKTIDPPGAPPAARVELLPAPLQAQDDIVRPGQHAPAIQVRTPMPAPPPSSAPIKLAPKLAE